MAYEKIFMSMISCLWALMLSGSRLDRDRMVVGSTICAISAPRQHQSPSNTKLLLATGGTQPWPFTNYM